MLGGEGRLGDVKDAPPWRVWYGEGGKVVGVV